MDPLNRPVKPIWRRKARKPLSEEIQSMYRLLSVTILLLMVLSTVGYLYTSSQSSAKGYMLKQLQLENESLNSKNRALNHQIINSQSFIEIEQNETLKQMKSTQEEDLSFIEDSNYAQN